MAKRKVKVATVVVGLHVYMVVSDPTSGKRNRFTVHKTALYGFKHTHVIGHEVTEGHARRLIAEHGAK